MKQLIADLRSGKVGSDSLAPVSRSAIYEWLRLLRSMKVVPTVGRPRKSA